MTAAQLVQPISLALLLAMAIDAGLKVNIEDVVSAFKRKREIILGLIANFIIIPAAAFILVKLFAAPPMVAVGFLLMAVCPGAPFALPGTTAARGDVPFAVGLMVSNVTLSVVLSPLLLGLLLSYVSVGQGLKIDFVKIITTLLISQLLPLGLTLWFHRAKPELSSKLVRPFDLIQNLLVLAVVVVGIAAQYQELAKFHLPFFVGFYLLFAIGWLSGWILGGRDKGVRKAMAFSTPQRNSGIALVIASANFPDTAAVPVAVIFAVLLALTGLVVQFVMRRL